MQGPEFFPDPVGDTSVSPKLKASMGLREAFTKGRFLMTLGQPPHMVLRNLLAYWESGQGRKNISMKLNTKLKYIH